MDFWEKRLLGPSKLWLPEDYSSSFLRWSSWIHGRLLYDSVNIELFKLMVGTFFNLQSRSRSSSSQHFKGLKTEPDNVKNASNCKQKPEHYFFSVEASPSNHEVWFSTIIHLYPAYLPSICDFLLPFKPCCHEAIENRRPRIVSIAVLWFEKWLGGAKEVRICFEQTDLNPAEALVLRWVVADDVAQCPIFLKFDFL